MALRIIWSPRAIAHLEGVCNYIAKDSEKYASIFAANILFIVKQLSKFPQHGRMVPEYGNPDLREKIYGSYRIVYRIKRQSLEVAAICHCKRPRSRLE